jgi:hypothetical protein
MNRWVFVQGRGGLVRPSDGALPPAASFAAAPAPGWSSRVVVRIVRVLVAIVLRKIDGNYYHRTYLTLSPPPKEGGGYILSSYNEGEKAK